MTVIPIVPAVIPKSEAEVVALTKALMFSKEFHLDVVDGGARPVGQPQIQRSAHHVQLDHDDGSGEPGVGQVEADRAHPAHQSQPGRHGPFAVPLQRPHHAP